MSSTVDIFNGALILMGSGLITAPTDASKRARILSARYTNIRKAVLRAHPWKCAHERTSIAATTDTIDFEFDNSYQLPTDYLKLVRLEYTDAKWRVEGTKILTNLGAPLRFIYTKDLTDPTKFDALLVEAISARLASDCAYAITNDKELAQGLWNMYREKLQEARSIDSQEQSMEDFADSEWLDSRYADA